MQVCDYINKVKTISKNTKYLAWYSSIIQSAMIRPKIIGYVEKHHILPKSLGGDNRDENIAILTAREHFICHKLLTKFTSGDSQRMLEHAFSYMVLTKNSVRPTHKITSHDFELARIICKKYRPQSWRDNISKAKKGKAMSQDSINKMRDSLTGRSLSDSHRANIGKSSTGRFLKPESIKKLSEAKGKSFLITFPDNSSEVISNLKTWCLERGFNYHTMHNNRDSGKRICCGPLKGFSVNTSTL